MKLSEYIRTNFQNQEAFAFLIGVSQATVSRYLSDEFIPSKKTMEKIKEVTNGEVQPNDFYSLKDDKDEAA